jgi:hypothetical protein
MKPIYIFLTALLISITTFSQTPQGMSYQAIVRDASNTLVAQQAVGIQISIIQGSTTGTAVYTETHTATTNTNGLVSLTVGTGATGDDFSAIDWAFGPYFIQTQIDPMGGSNYTITATSQLLSVPYALYAETAKNTLELPSLRDITGNNPVAFGDLTAFSGTLQTRSTLDVVADSDGDLFTGYVGGTSGDRFNIELDAANDKTIISSGGGYDLNIKTDSEQMFFEGNSITGSTVFNFNGGVVIDQELSTYNNITTTGNILANNLNTNGNITSTNQVQANVVTANILKLSTLSQTEIDNLSPEEGMVVYNTTTKKLQIYVAVVESEVIANTSVSTGATCMQSGNLWFTPDQSGTLTEIKLNAFGSGETASLVILDTSSCEGTGEVLGTSNTVNMVDGWNTWTFSTPVSVIAGNTYYVSSNDATNCLGVRWSNSGDNGKMGNVRDDDFICEDQNTDIATEITIELPGITNSVWLDLN